MTSTLHPGVYTREVQGGAKAIEAVTTATTIFVGETERGPFAATRILGRNDFFRKFGGYLRDDTVASTAVERNMMAYSIDGFYQNGGKDAYILRAVDPSADPATRTVQLQGGDSLELEASSPGVWGDRVSVAVLKPSDGNHPAKFRLVVMYEPLTNTGKDAKQIVEDWDNLSTDPDDDNYVFEALKRSEFVRWPEDAEGKPDPAADSPTAGALDDPNADITDENTLALAGTALSGGAGGDAVWPAASYPDLLARLDEIRDASLFVMPGKVTADFYNQGFAYVTSMRAHRDLFYVADISSQTGAATKTDAVTNAHTEFTGRNADNFVASYWPWIEVPDPVGDGIKVGRSPTYSVSASGHMAGVYARIDRRRGVWKTPAGTEATVQGITELGYELLDKHQDILNPAGLNALRKLPGAGIVCWGGRTMQPKTEWRYIAVRRTAIFLRMSIYNSIQWAVFEPNDHPLWSSLRLSIGAFMEQLFRQGAFAGKTSDEAYFVKVDEETTTPDDQAAGVVNIWVGFAPLRPAEFVVVSLSQKTQQTG